MHANGRLEPVQPHDEGDLVGRYLDQVSHTELLTAEEEVDLAKRIEAGVDAEHLLADAAAEHEHPGEERLSELRTIVNDGYLAKDHMIRANLRLVVSLAKRFSWSELTFLDLIQEGNLGLIRAVEKFDYTKGFKFSTYATWWIRKAIHAGIAETARTVRLPAYVTDQLDKIRRTEQELERRLAREATIEEIAAETGQPVERVVQLKRAARPAVSLNTPLAVGEDTQLGDLVMDPDAGTAAVELIESDALRQELRGVVDTLAPREALIMSLRYGLHDGRQRTLAEVADRVGLTRERVRQLERQSLAQLRDPDRHRRLLAWAG